MIFNAQRRRCGRAAALGLVLAAASATVPMAAHADVLDDIDQFDLVIEGTIASSCSLGTTGGTVDIGQLVQGQTNVSTFSLPLSCNIPFAMTFESVNGALTHERLASGQGPFAGSLGYTAAVEIPVRNAGNRTVATRTFTSAAMQSTTRYQTGPNQISDGPVKVTVTTNTITGTGLLAGKYNDVMRVTIEPRT